MGGLVFAGADGAPTHQGRPAGGQGGAARRRRLQPEREDRAARRLGPLLRPLGLSRPRHQHMGPIGFSATTDVPQSTGRADACRSVTRSRTGWSSRPERLGLSPASAATVRFVDPNKGAPRVQQCSADLQRELPMGMSLTLDYTGLRVRTGLGRRERYVDRYQPARPEVPGVSAGVTTLAGGQSVLRRRRSRASSPARRRGSRPAAASLPAVPGRLHDAVDRRALAVQRRHHSAAQAVHRPVGRKLQLHL